MLLGIGGAGGGNVRAGGALQVEGRTVTLVSRRAALAALLAAAALSGGEPGGEVQDLARMLWNADSGKRAEAALALGRRGPSALSALPHLVEALLDEEPEVKRAAAVALAKLGPAAVPALTSVVAEAEG